MTKMQYTPEEIAQGERLLDALAKIPEEMRPACDLIFDAMMLGAAAAYTYWNFSSWEGERE